MYFLINISYSHPLCHSIFEYVVADDDIDDVDDNNYHQHNNNKLKSKVTRLSIILSNRNVQYCTGI